MISSEFFQQLAENPLNWVLLTVTVFLVITATESSPPTPKATDHPKVILMKEYTKKELATFNGENSDLIYMALKGQVYDVSSGKSFYGPGGMYGNFAGRDASRGMAKNSFDEEMITIEGHDDLSDLSQEEMESMNEWNAFFANKYQLVGTLIGY